MTKAFKGILLLSYLLTTGSVLAVEVGDYVCTDAYGNNSEWCGTVVDTYKNAVKVEVSKVTCGSFMCIQLNESNCTGNKTLPVGSGGMEIIVKKYCLR